ncbi:putative NTE family protein [Calidithermus terrae]|uniref:Putative NTE family protein n=1 Tax=Calidithermus terrae TaxID=1408545 RepID=A0A399F668_9DEIN|nr:patatin-like phospholipase family protein [Calidithermus terrae]RIH90372.1 putative NTE family protein [Calidithermus terrae]
MGVVLALGGGGVRGVAHLGLLKVLRDEGVPIAGIAGSSAGALAASIYAFDLPLEPSFVLHTLYDPDLDRLQKSGKLRHWMRVMEFLRKPTLAEGRYYQEGLSRLFGTKNIEESPIPLVIQAADFNTGELVPLRTGSLAQAIRASSAIPSIFPPVRLDGRVLVDGDVAEKVPVTAAQSLGLGPVLAFDVSNPYVWSEPKTALEAALQAGEASRRRLVELALGQADLVVRLNPPHPIDTFDASQAGVLFELGQERAREVLPELRRLLRPPVSGAAPSPHWWSRLLKLAQKAS